MHREGRHHALRFELAKEQAAALAVSGSKLEQALAAYQARSGGPPGDSTAELDRLGDAVAARIDALVLQREAIGFRRDNLAWLRRSYRIPEAILARVAFGEPPPGPWHEIRLALPSECK